MSERGVAPYGSWRSPISSDLIVRGVVGLKEVVIDGGDVYWLESRPGEGGRNVVVLLTPDGRTEDVTPQPFNARTRVHEYGGGGFTAERGTVYFSNFADQRIYYLTPGDEPVPLTPETGKRDSRRRSGKRGGTLAHLGQRLLFLATPEPRWPASRVAGVEPSKHALGRYGANGLRSGHRRVSRERRADRRRPG